MDRVPGLITDLYRITAELERLTGRPFTLDGHLVGSLGEVYAAYLFDLDLQTPSTEGFDARAQDGRTVEIKATQRSSIAIAATGPMPDHLIALSIDEQGYPTVEYNGPARPAWDVAGKAMKTGQRRISLKRLRGVMSTVNDYQKLSRARDPDPQVPKRARSAFRSTAEGVCTCVRVRLRVASSSIGAMPQSQDHVSRCSG
jgi:hypothetical protein